MILTLVGKSAAGKTVIGTALEKLGYKKLVTYTTRNKRPGEHNGTDYWFVTDDEFDKMSERFADIKTYTMADGKTVKYGLSLDESEDYTYLIIDPYGYLHLRMLDVDMMGVLIHCRDSIRVRRSNDRGDKQDEINRRLNADQKDFEDLEQYVEYVVNNEYEGEIDKVAKQIDDLYKCYLQDKEG